MHIKTSEQGVLNLGFGNYSCNWGLHIAGLYETTSERDEIVNSYLAKGVQEDNRILYCPAEQTAEEFKEKFGAFCPECHTALKNREQFSLSSAKELYYPNGTFSPESMDAGLNAFYTESQKDGKKYVRATAEMVWALGAIPGIEHLMAYEARLNFFIPGKPWVSLCMYNTTKFNGSIILNVLRTHPYILNGGVVMQNPYFEDPVEWLSANSPRFLPK
ncbi:MAG TPA: MEDS domain-containing protein [Prolixibacteraceae bacterium]|nr:MEDS domain-containing protein [Prolixibacteraceae bacterium]